jgi:hypothetical protein
MPRYGNKKCPRPQRGGVVFAAPAHRALGPGGAVSKNHDKGCAEYMPRYLGQMQRLAEVDDLKNCGAVFTDHGGFRGRIPLGEGEAEKP